ncbi:MAG: heme exporter protein CcmB [Calditrichia bacterium]
MFRNAYIILKKDIQLEFRTRYAINAIFLFAVTTLIVISFSIGGARLSSNLLASLLWVTLFFSAMSGLSHIFIREEEQQTADTLRLLTNASSILLGKWLFNVILIFSLEIVLIPLFLIFLNVSSTNYSIFLAVLALGSLGLSAVATIVAAIIARASSRGALYAVLSFPLSITILVSAINGTKLAFENRPFSDCFTELQILFSFFIVMITASFLLFEFIWRD